MTSRSLFVVGASHQTAPFEFREKMALSAEQEACLSRELSEVSGLIEFVLVRTCNRLEIYGVGETGAVASRVMAAFCGRQGVSIHDFERFGFHLNGQDVITHLMSVAVGLESQILGETEIFGQLKVAYMVAQERGTVGSILNKVFQKAFQAAKQARSSTAITLGQVSVVNVAVDLTLHVFGRLEKAKVLLLGAGDMGTKSAKAFRSRGATHLSVGSRHIERAMKFSEDLSATAFAFEDRESHIKDADILVCSTSAAGVVVTRKAVQAAMLSRADRPLFIIDLAMPRDVEQTAGDLENVFLYNLDDLAEIAEENRLARVAESNRCRAFLAAKSSLLWTCVGALIERSATPMSHQPTLVGVNGAIA